MRSRCDRTRTAQVVTDELLVVVVPLVEQPAVDVPVDVLQVCDVPQVAAQSATVVEQAWVLVAQCAHSAVVEHEQPGGPQVEELEQPVETAPSNPVDSTSEPRMRASSFCICHLPKSNQSLQNASGGDGPR
jgi:hypothetical protein